MNAAMNESAELPELPDLPSTPGELHDMLQRLFGLGSYDDVTATQPYFRFRGREIAQLKSMLKRRRTSVVELGKAAWWADRQRLVIRTPFQLLRLVSTAVREWQLLDDAHQWARISAEVEDAVNEAIYVGENEWAERFARAESAELARLLAAWRDREDRS